MQHAYLTDNKILLRFEMGEDFIEQCRKFCENKEIHTAIFEGIGSIQDPVLGHYKVESKKYSQVKLNGVYEVLSLKGNITTNENELIIHAHMTISDDQMKAFGGHLVSGKVSATLEVGLTKFATKITKSFNQQIGLNLLDLSESS